MSEEGPVLYDTVELRRRIAGAFSAGELRTLADSLGVGGINWDRGLQEAAREVVRQSERYAGLPALVARLREERPLLEWPEPSATMGDPQRVPQTPPVATADPHAVPQPPAPSMPPVVAPAAQIPPTRAYPAVPTLSSTPGSFGPAPAPSLPDPYASPAAAPPPPVAPLPVPAAAPARPPPPTAGWPGVVGEPAQAARPGGIDPRIFVAVAGLMVLAAVIAYLAGRASTVPADAAGAPASSAVGATGAARADGPAALAADMLSRSFANLARVCELPTSAGTGAQVFRRIAERCGPPAPPRRITASGDPPLITTAQPAVPSADPAPPRTRRPGRGGDTGPGDAPAPAPAKGGCMGTCEAVHATCRAHCGAEPTEGSAYDGYQRCQGQCLRDASHCRLGCR